LQPLGRGMSRQWPSNSGSRHTAAHRSCGLLLPVQGGRCAGDAYCARLGGWQVAPNGIMSPRAGVAQTGSDAHAVSFRESEPQALTAAAGASCDCGFGHPDRWRRITRVPQAARRTVRSSRPNRGPSPVFGGSADGAPYQPVLTKRLASSGAGRLVAVDALAGC
jgi:hypothetical protein